MVIPKINSAHGSDTRNIINRVIDLINAQGKSIQDLVAEGQLTPSQYAQLISIVNDSAKNDDLNALKERFNEVITSDVEGVSVQEIIDARQGSNSLGDNLRDINTRTDIKFNNILNDGAFRKGIDSWYGGNGVNVSVVNGRLRASKSNSTNTIDVDRLIDLPANNQYLISIDYFKNSATGTAEYRPYLNVYYTDDTFDQLFFFEHTNEVQDKKIIFKPTKNVKRLRLRSHETASDKYIEFDNFSIINLTESFGSNIPSLDVIEEIIDEYFNGFVEQHGSLANTISSLIEKQVESEKNYIFRIKSLLINNTFLDGVGGWIDYNNSTSTVLNNKLRVTNNTGGINFQTRHNVNAEADQTYYIHVKNFSQSAVGATNPVINIYYADGTFEPIHRFDNSVKNQSAYLTFSPIKKISQITLVSYINTTGAYFEFEEAEFINLTENFKGSTPSAKRFSELLDKNYIYENGFYVSYFSDIVKSLMTTSSIGSTRLSTVINLESHGIDKTTGRILPSTSRNYSDVKRTGRYLKVTPDSILDIENVAGTVHVFEYASNYEFIKQGIASKDYQLQSGVDMIKVMVEGYSGDMLDITFSSPSSSVEWVKNERRTSGNHSFVFEVNPTVGRDISHEDTDNFHDNQYSNERYYTSGLLKLPPNYTPSGKPVKLIIYCHGSADYNSITSQSFGTNYEDYFQYLADEGYAILDVFSWTTKYPDAVGANFGSPIAKSGLIQGYEWVANNYNIDTAGVFISGKSAGGYQAFNLLYNNAMPIKALGLLAPAILTIHQPFGYTGSTKVAFANDFGFEGDTEGLLNIPGSILPMTPELRDYITLNASKLIGYTPMWNGIINGNFNTMLGNALDRNEKISEYEGLSRVNNVPTKIWSAIDDGNKDRGTYGMSRIYIHTLKNSNNIAEMRALPANTGGHNAVDSSPDALKVDEITTKLGITHTNVPLAYVELVSWFRRFGG